MPRTARKLGTTGIYHVMLRGIDCQTLFRDPTDFKAFLTILKECREISGFRLFAYCLMDNHVHLLLMAVKEDLSQSIKRIGIRYATLFNSKYDRIGHVFQDRFRSEAVETDAYFLTVLRYILRNPVKAGLCSCIEDYPYSSVSDYLQGTGICDTDYVYELYDHKALVDYLNTPSDEIGLDERVGHITDREASALICKTMAVENPAACIDFTKDQLEKTVPNLRKHGVSLRQLSRLTGISIGVLRKF